ncbi:hypothetical protein JTB14_036293 [Gonioctena quinquepunctata]|nr:hypothetical protein JTB14_036293 [Gonioctena quinquepunctata]
MNENVDQEEKPSLEEEIDKLSHEDLLEISQSSLRRLITADPLLNDLPVDVTVEEVLAQIAVAQGQSITVIVTRYLESPLNVVIPQKGTTVLELKKAIRRTFTLRQQRQRIKTKISWKYVWRTFNLQNVQNGQVMRSNKKEVSDYGIVNKSEIRFVKRLRKESPLLIVPLAVLEAEKYPWLEQISRQEQLMLGCDNISKKFKRNFNISDLDHILVDHNHKLLYCYVPKVACTNWKRVLMVLTGESNATNLVDIPASLAHSENSTLKLSQLTSPEAESCLREYTMFLVARHPFERLLSAYRNKFVDSLPSSKYFQSRYGRHIIRKYRSNPLRSDLKSGANVTFREFVHYLLKEGVTTNEHWTPIYDLCLPCSLNYTFIGHYEAISQDVKTVLSMVEAPSIVFPLTRHGHTKERLKFYFQQLSIHDIQALYKLYEPDFRLFGYGLEDLLGYDLA